MWQRHHCRRSGLTDESNRPGARPQRAGSSYSAMGRHKKSTRLSEREIVAFMDAATKLYECS